MLQNYTPLPHPTFAFRFLGTLLRKTVGIRGFSFYSKNCIVLFNATKCLLLRRRLFFRADFTQKKKRRFYAETFRVTSAKLHLCKICAKKTTRAFTAIPESEHSETKSARPRVCPETQSVLATVWRRTAYTTTTEFPIHRDCARRRATGSYSCNSLAHR